MILDSLTDFALYHNSKQNHNKVWGHFCHGNQLWAFWGGVGKAWNFKHHGDDLPWIRTTLQDLANTKTKKGYGIMSDLSVIDQMDPTWRLRFSERFTYFLLLKTSN